MTEKDVRYINEFRAIGNNPIEVANLKTIKDFFGNNVLRIPSRISGNKDDLIVFSDSNGLRHCRIFGEGFKPLHLLGWNDRHWHWGDKYIVSTLGYFIHGTNQRDRTAWLYKWVNQAMFIENDCWGGHHSWYQRPPVPKKMAWAELTRGEES